MKRYPLTIDATSKRIQELPIGDGLKIDGSLSVPEIIGNMDKTLNIESNEDLTLTINSDKRVRILGAGVFQLPIIANNQQRDNIIAEEGDIIYNQDQSTIQVYVRIASWDNGDPVPGWINLYNPPEEPDIIE